ncbi:hypothetical protein O181_108463 [Austropuccinia psidii MF-1]|uniref:HAT C-terminal dimerisation domain-containing protein n=1 Tax=Austropuccinia psidii MF-1 TaxID=1389203 RepID=A0A9Q3JSV7_9BASI|nr:hypothetical protein [Austropuccinia psidii MF-1]
MLTWFTQYDLLQEDETNSDEDPIKYKDEALKHLRELYAEYSSEYVINPSPNHQVSETPPINPKQLYPLEERMTKKTNEILWYFQTDSPPYSILILELWKNHETRFPILSKIARDCLEIPANSAPSECVFWKTGNLITNKWKSLLFDYVEKRKCSKSWLKKENY